MARKIEVEPLADSSSLERAFKRSGNSAKTFNQKLTAGAKETATGFTKMRGGALAAGAAGGGLAVVMDKLGEKLAESSDVASNLNEQISKSRQVFGNSSAAVEKWSKTTANSIGVAQDQALEATGVFGGLFGVVGTGQPKAAAMSRTMVQLAADMASFNNADPTEVLDALRSGLSGEAEPLRRFQVFLSEARVQQEAMRESGKRHARQLTDLDKVTARYNLILQQTVKQQGDFARTSDGLANSQRRLAANQRDLSGDVGKLLNPAITNLTNKLDDATLGALALADGLKKIGGVKIPEIKIPFNITVGGKSIGLGGDLKKGFGDALQDVPGLGTTVRLVDLFAKLGKSGGGKKPLPASRRPDDRAGLRGPGADAVAAAIKRAPRPTSLQGRFNIQELKLAQAQVSARLSDDRRILVVEKGITEQQIKAAKSLKDRTDRTNQLAGIVGQIRSIDTQAADALKAQAQARKDAAKQAADAAKQAAETARALKAARVQTTLDWLDFALEKAEATPGMKDNIRAEKNIIAFWKQRIKTEGRKLELVRSLWEAEQALHELQKKRKTTAAAAAKTVAAAAQPGISRLDALQRFAGLNQFGGNTWQRGAQVTVNQHFNAPTTDRHREARYALNATRAVFDG